jgi:nucleoside-diphosphate-sugar epimerase
MGRNKLLITGASGFVGRAVCNYIDFDQYEVHALTSSTNSTKSDSEIAFHQCDFLNRVEQERIFKALKASHLIHLAWNTEPSNYNLPINYDWLSSSMHMIELFAKYGGERLLITGSGVEYDWKYSFCNENSTPTSNESLYGACKNILRQFATSYCAEMGLSLTWPRLFFIYGPHENKARLIPHIISQLLNGNHASIKSGELYRDYLSVNEYGKAINQLFDSQVEGVINIASGIPTKIEDIALYIGSYLGREDLLRFEKMKEIKNRFVFADTSRFLNELAWKPLGNLNQGLNETIEWWKINIK